MIWIILIFAYLLISSWMIAYSMGRATRNYDAWLQQARSEARSMARDFERPE